MTAASRDSAVSGSLTTLSAELPVYTGYVEDGEIYNSLGYPAGASFIEVASEEMHLKLLPAARAVYAQENSHLTAASAQATGLPLAVATLVAGWPSASSSTGPSGGCPGAPTARSTSGCWWPRWRPGGADLDGRRAAGRPGGPAAGHRARLAPAETLAQADIAALQARGDETLNLISRTGDADFQQDFRAAQGTFSTLLTRAGQQSSASAAGSIAAARQDANSWFAVNQQAQKLDKALDYGAETRLVIGSGSGTAGTLFSRLEADLDTAIRAAQSTFADSAAAGSGAFTGLEAGVAVLALIMAIGSARGLSRRLAEYR